MNVLVPALLVAAALVDGAFAGFRASANRNARIFKRRYYAGALRKGACAAAVLALALGLLTALVLAVASEPAVRFAALVDVGARMLPVLGGYSALVAGALVTYALGTPELRSLATVAILGPFTLLRPVVVVVAAARGLWGSTDRLAWALTVLACAGVLGLGVWLRRGFDRRLREELARR